MKRLGQLSLLLFLLGFLVVAAQAQTPPWSNVLSSSRAINWSNAGVVGGIPSGSWTQCGSTIAAYGSSTSPGSPATIQNAINACGTNQYVQLGTGSFYLSGSIYVKSRSNMEIRGMGANSTFIYFYGNTGVGGDNCDGLYATVCFESGDVNFTNSGSTSTVSNGPVTWSAGYSQGTTVITLASVPNLRIGNPIILYQNSTSSDTGAILVQDVNTGGHSFTSPGSPGPYTGQAGVIITGSDQIHVYTVAGCNGSTNPGTSCSGTNVAVTISPGLEEGNWSSSFNPRAFWATSPSSNVGVQNLSIDGTNNGCSAGNGYGVAFFNTVNVWERGVRDTNECLAHVGFQYTAHATIRDNYMFLARYSTSTSYGVDCDVSSDSLIENNIFQAIAGAVIFSEGCNTTVEGYNFEINGYYAVAGFVIPMTNMHAVNNDLILVEGNIGSKVDGDIIHGTHNLNTFFRNYMSGQNPVCWQSGPNTSNYAAYINATWGNCLAGGISAIQDSAFNRFTNILGNVLGTTGVTTLYQGTGNFPVYSLGLGYTDGLTGVIVPNDPATIQTLYRWGNCDSVNGFSASSCQWNSSEVPTSASLAASQQPYAQAVPSGHTLPASFYYSSTPSWWPSGKPFPIIGPDVTGGNISAVNGLAYTNPAEDCYLSLTGATANGTGGPFPFDANTCYGSGSTGGTLPAAPTNLTATVN